MVSLKCNPEAVQLMHKYLDGDLIKTEEMQLKRHLEDCEACQQHFHELKRTITLIQSAEHLEAPANFTTNVMKNLPTEKKRIRYLRWFKMHPMLTAAAIFFVLMFTGVLSSWDQGNELVVSKQENLVIEGDTVIVPKGEIVEGDLLVKNGNLIIYGTVDGNVTLVNGKLIEDNPLDGSGLMASVGEVNGEFETINQIFDWVWYKTKNFARNIFSLD